MHLSVFPPLQHSQTPPYSAFPGVLCEFMQFLGLSHTIDSSYCPKVSQHYCQYYMYTFCLLDPLTFPNITEQLQCSGTRISDFGTVSPQISSFSHFPMALSLGPALSVCSADLSTRPKSDWSVSALEKQGRSGAVQRV